MSRRAAFMSVHAGQPIVRNLGSGALGHKFGVGMARLSVLALFLDR